MSAMPYRAVTSPPPPPQSDLETPEMVEAALAVERIEQDVLMLTELA
jgi:hypothetical protein